MLEEGYCPQWQTYNWIWVGKIFSILVEMGQQLLLLYPIRSHIQRKKNIYILTTNLPSNKPWNKKRNAHKTCVKINSFNVQQKRKILKFWCWTICDYEKKGKVKTGEDVFQGLKNNWKKKKKSRWNSFGLLIYLHWTDNLNNWHVSPCQDVCSHKNGVVPTVKLSCCYWILPAHCVKRFVSLG